MINLKLLWSYIDWLNLLNNDVVLTVVPIGHVTNVLGESNKDKDMLNDVSSKQSYPRLLVLQTLIGIYMYLI